MPPSDGFVSALFDFSFSTFVTTKIVKVLYGLWIVMDALAALIFIIYGFKISSTIGLLVLIVVAPICFILFACYGRVALELTMVIFKIETNTRNVSEQTSQIATTSRRIADKTSEVATHSARIGQVAPVVNADD